ncbi:MAG: HEAT repeat domain-containing protein [Gemmatimonadota bacterium]
MSEWIVLGEAANEAVLALLLKVTLVLAAGLVTTLLLRRASAALRHATLVGTLAAAVLLPALTLSLPAWNVPVFDDASAPDRREPAGLTLDQPAFGVALDAPAGPAFSARTEAPRSADPTAAEIPGREAPDIVTMAGPQERPVGTPWMAILLGAWAVGAAVGMGRAGFDLLRMSALVRDAVHDPWGPQAVRSRRIAERLGIGRPVRILFSEHVPVPATWGVLRPVVILPIEAWDWGPEKSRIVLLHELAHVRRVDCLSFGLTEAVSAMWWFHPLLWLCRKRLRVEQERACDDVVLLDGIRATEYAAMLTEFARGFPAMADTAIARAAIAMARPSTLRDRVETILATGSRSLRLGRRQVVILTGAVAALVIPLATAHLWGETTEARETARWIASLEDEEARVRESAAWSLGARRSEEAVKPLIESLADDDPRVRGVAARALGRIGDERAFAHVAAVLRDPDPKVRELAVLGLAEIEDERRLEILIPMLDDPDMGVRSVTVSALSQLEGWRALEALAGVALDDADSHTRSMAIDGIGKRADEARAVVPGLVRLLSDEDPSIRAQGARLLGEEIGDARAVPALVAMLEREPDADVRTEVVQALAAFADREPAFQALLTAMADQEWRIRVVAAGALGESHDERAVPTLLGALRDPMHQVRLESACALDEIESSR